MRSQCSDESLIISVSEPRFILPFQLQLLKILVDLVREVKEEDISEFGRNLKSKSLVRGFNYFVFLCRRDSAANNLRRSIFDEAIDLQYYTNSTPVAGIFFIPNFSILSNMSSYQLRP